MYIYTNQPSSWLFIFALLRIHVRIGHTYVYIYTHAERERVSLSLESGTCTACTYEAISARMQTCDSHTWMIIGCMWDFLVARGKWALHQFCFYTHHAWMSLHVTSCGALFGTISRAVCTEHIDIFRAFTTSDIMWTGPAWSQGEAGGNHFHRQTRVLMCSDPITFSHHCPYKPILCQTRCLLATL